MNISLKLSRSQHFITVCVFAGVACGLIGVGFHLAIAEVFGGLWSTYSGLGALVWPAMILTPAVAGLIVGLLLQFIEPGAVGSGIPQVKAAYHTQDGSIPGRQAFWRFIAGVISVGGGNSLGREGPTVHICSASCSQLGRLFRLDKERIRAMVPVGMAAGISAAFNAPIAAIMFVIEELLDDFSSAALGGILIAVVIAAVVERTLLGEEGALMTRSVEFATEPWMLVCLVLGPVAGLLGHLFVTSLLKARARARTLTMPAWVRPAAGGLSVGLIGTLVFALSDGHHGVFSIGYADLTSALAGELGLLALALLLIGKMIATVLCYASGASGGIFAPVLFIGAMLGGVFGVVEVELLKLSPDVAAAVALLGTGAFFAAVIRCPITSILIIFEMTRNYSLILPLMAGNLIAYAIAVRLRPIPVYDALLLQDGVNLRDLPQYQGKRNWKHIPVSAIMSAAPLSLSSSFSAERALGAIAEAGVSHRSYPVIDPESHRVDGLISHHELETLAANEVDKPLLNIVVGRKLVMLRPELRVDKAIAELLAQDVPRAPVVSDDGDCRLLGMITINDIVRQQNMTRDKETGEFNV